NFSWTLEGQNDPILHMSNESERVINVRMRILFGENTYRYPKDVTVPAGENSFIKVREILTLIAERYPEVKSETTGLLQAEFDGLDREIKTRMINLNPKSGVTSERESENTVNPVIRSIDPDVGDPAGGTVITIQGQNFDEGSSVKFNGVPVLHNRQSENVLIV